MPPETRAAQPERALAVVPDSEKPKEKKAIEASEAIEEALPLLKRLCRDAFIDPCWNFGKALNAAMTKTETTKPEIWAADIDSVFKAFESSRRTYETRAEQLRICEDTKKWIDGAIAELCLDSRDTCIAVYEQRCRELEERIISKTGQCTDLKKQLEECQAKLEELKARPGAQLEGKDVQVPVEPARSKSQSAEPAAAQKATQATAVPAKAEAAQTPNKSKG